MANLHPHFEIKDYDLAKSHDGAMILGNVYRITILSEILIRIEYSETGTFEDRPTELVKFRRFDIPKFVKKEDEHHIVISTNYFKVEYNKGKPMFGNKLTPDQFFKVSLNNTDKFWYFGHPEARNFKGTAISLDDTEGTVNYEKGLYSTDGFVSLDDSQTLIFNPDGSLGKRADERIDTYLFMYRKDFGFCLRDYFKLTGKPVMLPRYALGVWWNKDYPYSTDELEKLVWEFSKNEVPLSYNQSLEYFSHKKENKTVAIGFINMARRYKLKDISWLYDVSFELLNDRKVKSIILIGPYAYDLAVRLKLAGIDDSIITCCPNPEDIVDCLLKYSTRRLYCIFFFDLDRLLRAKLLKRGIEV